MTNVPRQAFCPPSIIHHSSFCISSPSAFTLLELLISLVIVAVLLVAMQSVMLLAARALPDGRNGPGAALSAARAVDWLAYDLSQATAIVSAGATDLTITVPDQGGPAAAETIRYHWSGVPGEPLLRTYNVAPAQEMALNLQEFALAYSTRTPSGSTTPLLQSVQITLRAGRDPKSRIITTVRILNEPQVN